jgi:hypothetical protein
MLESEKECEKPKSVPLAGELRPKPPLIGGWTFWTLPKSQKSKKTNFGLF